MNFRKIRFDQMAGLRNWWAGDRRSALTDFPELIYLDFSELVYLDFHELISLEFIPWSAFQRLWSGTNLLFSALGCTHSKSSQWWLNHFPQSVTLLSRFSLPTLVFHSPTPNVTWSFIFMVPAQIPCVISSQTSI